VLGTIPSSRVRLPPLEAIRARSDVVIFEVTVNNRSALADQLAGVLAPGVDLMSSAAFHS
jgi:hypothetical protein